MSPVITVHLRVNDAATNQPTPARLRIADADGRFFAPLGHSPDFPLGRNEAVGGSVYLDGKKFCYINGACEISLPTGVPLEVEISKGLEFEPIHESVTLGPGQMALRFSMRRWIDMRAEGWQSADTRCHFLSPHDALLEAAAEGVDLVHLLATEHDMPSADGHLYRTTPNLTAFSGQRAALESGGHAVFVNTFNTHPFLGKVGLLNSHRPVFPLSFGDADGSDDWSVSDWCDQCHRKGGLVVWCDAFRDNIGGEALIALMLGKIDAIEFDAGERSSPFLPLYYHLLNAGLRVPLVGGSAKCGNRTAVGAMRTYSRMPESDRSLATWVERTRQGHTFVTNGPLIEVRLNGEDNRFARIEARARSRVAFEQLEIIANGEVLAKVSPTGPPYEASVVHDIEPFRGGWAAVRCRGAAPSELKPTAAIFAHTSPIWMESSAHPPIVDNRAITFIRRAVEQTRDWAENHGCFREPKRRAALLDRCDLALRKLAEGSVLPREVR